MHAVILAAGEGSRMGTRTADVPKAFMTIDGRTLYDRQRAAVDDVVDGVTVVLGYAHENVRDGIASARAVIFEDWADYENAESLRRGIKGIADDVLVLNGDVVVAEAAVRRLVRRHEATGDSVVACLPGVQEGDTAVRSDERGRVVEYGLIPGPQHAGMGIVDRDHLGRARAWLGQNCCEWYPGLYTAVETLAVTIPEIQHVEINYPRDVATARRRFPLGSADELDAET